MDCARLLARSRARRALHQPTSRRGRPTSCNSSTASCVPSRKNGPGGWRVLCAILPAAGAPVVSCGRYSDTVSACYIEPSPLRIRTDGNKRRRCMRKLCAREAERATNYRQGWSGRGDRRFFSAPSIPRAPPPVDPPDLDPRAVPLRQVGIVCSWSGDARVVEPKHLDSSRSSILGAQLPSGFTSRRYDESLPRMQIHHLPYTQAYSVRPSGCNGVERSIARPRQTVICALSRLLYSESFQQWLSGCLPWLLMREKHQQNLPGTLNQP